MENAPFPVVITKHAEKRGKQLFLQEKDILIALRHATRLRNFFRAKNNYRYYQNGDLVFVLERKNKQYNIITLYSNYRRRKDI